MPAVLRDRRPDPGHVARDRARSGRVGADGAGHDGSVDDGQQFRPGDGPIAVGAVVSAWGWNAACVMVVAAAILAGLAAWMLARSDHKRVSEASDPA
ncbi:hypothetical protein [Bradyrhizobium embrapense]|uniref:hypothetical protein n=1 Tax=Bradyrhizobium embrapense TaxID=630921 RepID=UPI0012F4CEAB|nr:hypothetical protein [Bradyrhizobium embrapense]